MLHHLYDYWEQSCTFVHDAGYGGDRFFVVALASLVHAIGLWGSCFFFLSLDYFSLFQEYKIKRVRKDMLATNPKNIELDRMAFIEQIVGTFVVVPLVVYLVYPGLEYREMVVCEGNIPSLSIIMRDFVILLFSCDTIFYWTHRLLHANGWLYRNIHKKHHEFKATTIWASEYFGIVDMILNILPGVIPAIIMKSHFMVLMIFTFIRQWQTVQSHAGYDLPFDPLNRGIFYDGAKRHDYHHSHNLGCYGDWSPFWDYVMGTDVKYKKYWAEKKKKV